MVKQLAILQRKNNYAYEKETSDNFTIIEEKVETILKVLREKDIIIQELEKKFESIEVNFEEKKLDLEKVLKQKQIKTRYALLKCSAQLS